MNKKEIFSFAILTLVALLLVYVCLSFVCVPKDILMKETPDSLYYKEYYNFGKDFKIKHYRKPIYHKCVVLDKRFFKTEPVVGARKESDEHYKVTVSKNGKRIDFEQKALYKEINNNDTVVFEECWYPHHFIRIYGIVKNDTRK